VAAACSLLLGAALAGSQSTPASAGAERSVTVVVQERSPQTADAERAVRRAGGSVTRALPIVNGFAARIPLRAMPSVKASPAVAAVWRDGPIEMTDFDDDDIRDYDTLPPNDVWRQAIRLQDVPAAANSGRGVRVAVLDTGVTRHADVEDAVVVRADLTPDGDGVDRYGHGTHMAGIVAGDGTLSAGRWRGVAEQSELVAVKVAGWDGATDVSAVLAGLQWVASHRRQHRIRVLNLSFTTDSYTTYARDPLNFAVERLWEAGILVVAAAGNRGSGDGTISKPGDDPYVVTVGAADLRGTVERSDDLVAGFSSIGPTQDGFAKPDLVAPGVTVVSGRAPGSMVDDFRPEARVDEHYFKGTGSSQAAAVVSGVAALMFAAKPSLTPDVAKATLVGTTDRTLSQQRGGGAGLVDAAAAVDASVRGTYAFRPANRRLLPSSGLGVLNESRGSNRVYTDFDGDGKPDKIDNELDALGATWEPNGWTATLWTPLSWLRSPWHPLFFVGAGWEPLLSGGGSWPGMSMEVETWGAKYWTESGWDAKYWTNKYWTTSEWN
jgi:serine protease AprX